MAALLVAVFTASAAFGVLLPMLPELIERILGPGAAPARISRHTGLLTAVYPFALFLFAPAWGWLSDRHGRRTVLLAGLLGLGATMLAFSFADGLTTLYAERFLSGMFASGVIPAASAAIGESSAAGQERGRRLAFVSMAGVAGLLLGPMLSGLIGRFAAHALAAAALLAALAVAVAFPGSAGKSTRASMPAAGKSDPLLLKLLFLAFIVSAGIGVFDVGLTLRGDQALGLTPHKIALMLAACGLVMLTMQAMVFSPWVSPDTTPRFIAPALAVLAAGLFLLPWASDFAVMLALTAGVAAGAGILPPILSFWISTKAAKAQGRELGKQSAAVSLGVTLGSAGGGLLSDLPAFPNAPFILTAALAVLGVLLSLRLPELLNPEGGQA